MKKLTIVCSAFALLLLGACEEAEDNPAETSECVAGATQLCACSTGAVGAQVCAGDESGWGACDCASAPSVSGVELGVTDADDANAIGLVTTHVVGQNDCLQTLGSIDLTNGTSESAQVEISTREVLPQIIFAPASPATVDPGGTTTVSVEFNCELLPSWPPADISTAVTVASSADPDGGIVFPLRLTFECPDGGSGCF